MRYFATADDQESVGKKKKSSGGMTEVEEQILGTTQLHFFVIIPVVCVHLYL